jgi:hypothetical protein
MEIPRYAPREPGGGPPHIYDHPTRFDARRSDMPLSSSSSPPSRDSPSLPRIIPSRYHHDPDVPPPLPPPKFLPASALQTPVMGPRRDYRKDNQAMNSMFFSKRDVPGPFPHLKHQRKASGDSDDSMDGASTSRNEIEPCHNLNINFSVGSQDALPKFMSHAHFQFNKPRSNDFDNSLLKKLDLRRSFDNHSPPRSSAPATTVATHPTSCQLSKLSLPIRSNKSIIDSPGRYTDTPLPITASPRILPYHGAGSNEYRSPVEPSEHDYLPFARNRRNNSGSFPDDITVSTHSSSDRADDTDYTMDEGMGIKRLANDDRLSRSDYQTAGLKRRAISPPFEDVPMQGLSGSAEFLRRREGASRSSPTPRLTVIPQGSVSSASSVGRSAGSYASTMSLAASSISSINSYGRVSPPSGLSSGGLSPVDICNSPFNNSISLTQSPCAPIQRSLPAQRSLNNEPRSLGTLRKVTEVSKSSISKIQSGFFMCECCPKKPKKFDTEEDLQ